MSGLFALLWLVGNVVTIVFIIKTIKEKDPDAKKAKRNKWLISFAATCLCLIIFAVSLPSTDKKEEVTDTNTEAATEVKEEAPEKEAAVEEVKEEVPEEATEEPEEETKTEADINKEFIEKYDTDFVASASLTLERFLDKKTYKMSLAPQKWTIAKFDETDTLIGSTDITYNGVVTTYYFVGTLQFDDDGKVTSTQPHYVAVGNTVLGDDGYCDEVFDKLKALTGE